MLFDPALMYGRSSPSSRTTVKLGVGVCVADGRGRVLLERRSDCGWWGLLGGAVEPGETILQAAVREVREESGLEVRVTRLIGIYSEPKERIVVYQDNGDERHLVDVILEATVVAGSLRCSPESLDLEFFAKDALPRDIVPPARQPIEDYFCNLQNLVR